MKNFIKTILLLLSTFATERAHAQFIAVSVSGGHSASIFEACVGDVVTIYMNNFVSFTPTEMIFANASGVDTTVSIGAAFVYTNTTASCNTNPPGGRITPVRTAGLTAAGTECGTIVFTVPSNMGSGLIEVNNGAGQAFYFSFEVRNPYVYLGALPSVVCSKDTILFKETPQGNSSNSSYTLTNVLTASPYTTTDYIERTPSNMGAQYAGYHSAFIPGGINGAASITSSAYRVNVQIEYAYTPMLQSTFPTPEACPQKKFTQTTNVRSNELSSVTYNEVDASNNTQPIVLTSTSPPYWATAPAGVTFSYSGTYVNNNGMTFRAATTGPGFYTVKTNIDNGGCKVEQNGSLRVKGDNDAVVCRSDGAYTLYRDPAFPYASAGGIDQNKIVTYAYSAPSYPSGLAATAISPVAHTFSLSTSADSLILNLNAIPPGDNFVVVYLDYYDHYTTPNLYSYKGSETYTITLFDPATTSIGLPQSTYCEEGGVISLNVSPSDGVCDIYTITGPLASSTATLSIPSPPYILDPSNSATTPLEPASDTINTQYMLVYTAGPPGCVGRDTAFVTIAEPISPDFVGRHSSATPVNAYCKNEAVDLLTPYPLPGGGGTGVFSGNGIVTGTSQFVPSAVTAGTHTITYTYTTLYGCQSSKAKVFTVNAVPSVDFNTYSSTNEFCANENSVTLNGTPSGPGGVFYGAGVFGNNFNPSIAFGTPVTSGTTYITYSYTDANACQDSITKTIEVHPVSVTTINGFPADDQFCIYDNIINVSASSTPDQDTGYFAGNGFIGSAGNIYLYNPFTAGGDSLNGGGVFDTVMYFHTNSFGCKDTAIKVITIDTMPQPDILWPAIPVASAATLPHLHYCVNNIDFILNGYPTPNTTAGVDSFYGPGVSAYISAASPTQTFSAAAAGTGLKDISYRFTDNNGCSNTVTERIEIRPLPTANFTGLLPQYCEDAADDDLVEPQEVTGQGSGVFSGDGIINTADGILSPQTEFAADGPGFKTVMYTFTDTFGCVGIDSQNYYLNPLPIVNLLGLDSAYCQNRGDVVMQGIPFGTGSNYPQVGVIPSMASIGNGQAEVNTDSLNAGQIYTFRYVYTDANGCTNRDSISTEIFAAPIPDITGLDSQYCETQDSFLLIGTPTGGVFSGPGLLGTDYFKPYRAGPGTHNISYTASNTNIATLTGAVLVCYETVTEQTTVYPLPVPDIVFPDQNTAYCESDERDSLIGIITNPLQGALESYYWYGTGIDVDTALTPFIIIIGGNPIQVFIPTYSYYFSPAMAHAAGGQGVYASTYVAENIYGCVDSLTYNYSVYTNPTPAFATDNEVCEGDGETTLFGSPGGGIFSLNGTVLNPPIYNPNPNYPVTIGADKLDTLVYEVTNTGFTACIGRDTQVVLVHPNPQLDYVAIDDSGDTTYQSCIGQDTLSLIPNIWGGEFNGAGVLFGSSEFIPNIAGVGEHEVSYSYTDTATSCANTFIHTFYTYNTPNIEFAVDGGCGDEIFTFTPDNNVLGLNGLFLNQQYDTITFIQWDYGDGITANPNPSLGTVNELDPASHLYATYGVYNVSLFVQNNNYCWGTDTVRIIVSPSVTPTAAAPYSQDFEADNGGWFDQLEGSDQESGIWNWTVATGGTINTANNSHNLVWVTHGDEPYGQNENAWVYGPCVDLTELDRPMIKLDYFSDTDLGNDGVVIEYYSQSANAWLPLGNVEKGIDWYNRDVIAGRPGIQDLAPIGWSGELNGWKNGRLRLDDYQNYEHFRFRIAFGAVGVQNRGLEGFAFDNVWIGNRTRNVLLEHFANIEYPSMVPTNDHLYDLVYNTSLVKDVHLVQYHIDVPGFDEFNIINEADPATRTLYYGISQAGRAVIDGKRYGAAAPLSLYLSENDFEYEMLETPKFDIAINDFYVVGNQVYTDVSVEAAQNMPHSEYALQIALVEDSLVYQEAQFFVGNMATLRGFIPSAAGASFVQSWAAGDQAQVTEQWELPAGSFDSTRFELVVFIQDYNTKEVFQVASTRDLTVFPGYYYNGINEVEPEVLEQAQQISNMKLYPNPTSNHFTVEFDLPLSQEYQWRLTDMRGVTVQSGLAPANITQLSVEQLDLPAGMYIFSMHADKFFTQRKVIIRNN